MGGDHAPELVIRGAALACARHPDARMLLVGDSGRIQPLLKRHPALRERCDLIPSGTSVAADEKPSHALRNKTGSSMALAIGAVRDGTADAAVSAGNTGALMAFAVRFLECLPGIHRPAIAATIPTRRSESVLLDMGANAECEVDHLVQFAVMGTAFAQVVLGRMDPEIRLLNIGQERGKGRAAIREADVRLRAGPLGRHYRGYIEGDGVTAGRADVVVTDGFTGNVMLKTAEGTAKLCSHYLRTALRSSVGGIVAGMLARPALQALRDKLDPRKHNGAILLGLNGVTVKSHGGTDAMGFAHSIDVAYDMVQGDMNQHILHAIRDLGDSGRPAGRPELAHSSGAAASDSRCTQ